MALARRHVGRRTFLQTAGRAAAGVLVMGVLPACTAADGGTVAAGGSSAAPSAGAGPAPATDPVDWRRVDLGFVSAYVLVRSDEAAVVDTGVAGSEGDIEDALDELGLAWTDVGHVILTHRHPDHVGSAPAVLERATAATAYAGAGDAEAITTPGELEVVTDGDVVFGLRIIATPGHTAGHISVLDEAGGLLVAGDALVGAGGTVAGPDPQYADDMAQAQASVRRLARHTFDTAVFGHGEPVAGGAGDAVAELAARMAVSSPPPEPPATGSGASAAPTPGGATPGSGATG